jgi:tellurite resistance protein
LSHRRPGGFGATGRRTPCGARGSDHEPLPVRLTPTLFILLAPPSVGFVSYTALTGQLDAALIGQLDAAARVLYYTALFLTLLLATNAARFLEVPFYLSAWAYSFPLAAMTIATLVMFARSGVALFGALGAALLAALTAIVGWLVARTAQAMRDRAICVPE